MKNFIIRVSIFLLLVSMHLGQASELRQRLETAMGIKKIPHATESLFTNVLMQEKLKQLKSLQEERDQIKATNKRKQGRFVPY